jgi:hypothetical protein
MLLELGVEIGVGEAALRPVLMDDDITLLWAELRIELAAPCAAFERLRGNTRLLERRHVSPAVEVVRVGPVMRHDEDLDLRGTGGRDDLAQIVEHAGRIGGRLDRLVELATLGHEVVIWVDDQQPGTLCCIGFGGHDDVFSVASQDRSRERPTRFK